ncbi:hypothetical protein KSB_02940 [Ktedonobacter robiniae]|uniref:Uncharacterized protein n=1 Tax=Ktedonobacter robiniae TaxID=2778365 RepID=A0ABQ3UGJ1_9CHLR|nr:hypothetical protein KSB_02940 [Ktedonobacter robiniae]
MLTPKYSHLRWLAVLLVRLWRSRDQDAGGWVCNFTTGILTPGREGLAESFPDRKARGQQLG